MYKGIKYYYNKFFSAKFINLKRLTAVRNLKITKCFSCVAAELQAGMWGCVIKIACVLKLCFGCQIHALAILLHENKLPVPNGHRPRWVKIWSGDVV